MATGFQFTEGPIWHSQGWLFFSDIPADTIYRWSPTNGVEIYLRPSQHSNGLTLDKQGRLVACEHSGRRVSSMADDYTMTTLASKYQGLRLNSPNDLVFHSSGSLYFTDPNYGIEPEESELGFQGVFRLNIDGTLELLISDFDGPNGLAFSPDESTLYVGDSRRRKTWAFEHRSDGSIREGDFVELDGGMVGTVEQIGWRSTRIRLLADNMVIVPNGRLADNLSVNYNYPEEEMSVYLQVGVAYSSNLEHVEQVTVEVARKVLAETPGSVQPYEPSVWYTDFGDSNINFWVVLRAKNYLESWTVKHAFVKALFQRYNEEGIEISFPARNIYMRSDT